MVDNHEDAGVQQVTRKKSVAVKATQPLVLDVDQIIRQEALSQAVKRSLKLGEGNDHIVERAIRFETYLRTGK